MTRTPNSHVPIFILLLICASCIAPALAADDQKNAVVDGVHIIEFDDSPAILDKKFYNMEPNVNFVVDGTQNYWVRIGNVKAEGLTTVWWAIWLSIGCFSLFCGFFAWYWVHGIPRFYPHAFPKDVTPRDQLKARLRYSLPLIGFGILLHFSLISGILPNAFTHATCGDFIDLKASDGTILLKVDKLHPDSNPLFARSGLNLSTMTHLSCSGEILNPRPWSGSIHDLRIVSL